jgi:ATP-dependent Lon protease
MERLLPLFPLPELVVFPGLWIPLYIFEDRYKQMTRDLLTQPEDERRLVLVQSRSDGSYCSVGGYVRLVMASENPDGSFHIACRGEDRCHVQEARKGERLYHQVPDRPFALKRSDPAQEAVAAWDGMDAFRQYVAGKADPKALDEALVNIPEDPLYQASFLCVNLQTTAEDRQAMLEAPSLVERLELARTIMRQGSIFGGVAEA